MKICLDPGHYGKYNSGIIKGYYESEMNLKLAYKLKAALERYGAEVFLTRTGTEDLSLYSRGQVAAKNNCDVFFSIHSNARSGDNSHRIPCVDILMISKTTAEITVFSPITGNQVFV